MAYKAQDFIDAIPGSGGVISTIARRVGCDWNTAKKYVTEYTTVADAYQQEVEQNLDVAESVVITNIKAARKLQEQAIVNKNYSAAMVDTGDVFKYLKYKAKDRGYVERQEVDNTHSVKGIDLNEWKKQRQELVDKAAETLQEFSE